MSVLRSAGTVAAVLAAMAVGRVVTDHVPVDLIQADSFVHAGKVGETIELPYADIEVTQVRGAGQLRGLELVQAAGEYLVIDLTMTATDHNVTVAGVALHDAQGRIHLNEDRGYCALNATLRTAATWHTQFCFDVPADALEGATLRLGRGPWVNDGQRRDAVAEIDLGIDNEFAEEIAAETAEVPSFQGDFEPQTVGGAS